MIFGITWKRFFGELWQEMYEDDIFNGAAALGFWLTLAIFPAMIFTMAVLPYLPIERVDEAIMDLLRQSLPPSAAEMFSGVVEEVTSEPRGGLLSFGLVATFWAASAGMIAIMDQLNVTYDVAEGRSFLRARATAFGLSVLFLTLVIGAFSLVVMGGILQDWIAARFGASQTLLTFFVVFRWTMIVAALLLGFALIYYLGPNVEQDFRFISPGSIIGVVLLVAASLAFRYYAANFGDYDATYGSIGAVIVLMLWLYIAGFVILLGSEINALVEHYAPAGKEKGEKVPGEHERPGSRAPGRQPPPPPPPGGRQQRR